MGAAGIGYIALGGAIGAVARYAVTLGISNRLPQSTFPWGTFVINMTGAFVIGFVLTLLSERVIVSPNWRPLVTTGFVGAYTTFSTLEWETARLGASWQAVGNLFGSVVVGYLCVLLGIRAALLLAWAARG